MLDLQIKFKNHAERFLFRGQRLRIATDINGTLIGMNVKQRLCDRDVPFNVRLIKFLMLAKMAGHDVHAFTNDVEQNSKLLPMLEGPVFQPLFDELSIDVDDAEMILREVFGKQEDGSYWCVRKDIRNDVGAFRDGVDIVFEDEQADWANPFGLVFVPESELAIDFLDDFVANPDKIKHVQDNNFLALPWLQRDFG